MSELLVCECGATRASAGLRTMACVNCGRAMHAPLPPAEPRPGTGVLAASAAVSQLACISVLALAIRWLVVSSEASPPVIGFATVALFGLFAGARTYRGQVFSLLLAAVIDAGVAGILLARTGLGASLTSTQEIVDPDSLALAVAALAALAAVLCAIAIPQARRYTAWQQAQLERAVQARRL